MRQGRRTADWIRRDAAMSDVRQRETGTSDVARGTPGQEPRHREDGACASGPPRASQQLQPLGTGKLNLRKRTALRKSRASSHQKKIRTKRNAWDEPLSRGAPRRHGRQLYFQTELQWADQVTLECHLRRFDDDLLIRAMLPQVLDLVRHSLSESRLSADRASFLRWLSPIHRRSDRKAIVPRFQRVAPYSQ